MVIVLHYPLFEADLNFIPIERQMKLDLSNDQISLKYRGRLHGY